jgi:hypothetical protein
LDRAKQESIYEELAGFFGRENVSEKQLPDERVAFKIRGAPMPPGCAPDSIEALMVYTNGDPPLVLVRQGVKLKSGVTPRSTESVTIDGEPWMRFSARFQYDRSRPAWFFLTGMLWRFAQPD